MGHVPRTFDASFILFDLLLCCIWIFFLVRGRHFKALLFGLFGFVVYFAADDLLWFHTLGTRVFLSLPPYLTPDLFLLYFSLTYGMLQFSLASLLFSLNIGTTKKIAWSAALFAGWLAIGFLSKLIVSGDTVSLYRDMGSQRLIQAISVIAEYAVLIVLMYTVRPLQIRWTDIALVLFAGIYIHFAMEMTLYITGIRGGKFDVLIFNSLIEFNTGAPILFLLNRLIKRPSN